MSELREAIARAMAEANGEPENWEAWLIDADAALAAIEAQGVRLVWMTPAVLPGPQSFGETTITITEPTTLTLQMGQPGGAGGPKPRPRSEGQ